MTAPAALFDRHLPRAVVEAVVEQRLGSVVQDDPKRLAERLGYLPAGECEVLLLA